MSKELIFAAAGSAGGGGLAIEDVFSTTLYTGNGGSQTITNGIDLDGEGGLVWVKNLGSTTDHQVADTVRGSSNFGTVISTNTNASQVFVGSINSTNSDGFNVVSAGTGSYDVNVSSNSYASFTFRKAEKFFDMVTWSGNGTAGRQIPHNLGSVPGMIIVKRFDNTGYWPIWHRGIYATDPDGAVQLQNTAPSTSFAGDYYFGNQTGSNTIPPTDSVFTVGADYNVNYVGGSYIAYIFAHDSGGFGSGSDSATYCGYYTGNGGTQQINIGWQPQWILVKNISTSASWNMYDTERGWIDSSVSTTADSKRMYADTGGAQNNANGIYTNSTGFLLNKSYTGINSSGHNFIYLAIRKPIT